MIVQHTQFVSNILNARVNGQIIDDEIIFAD